MGSNGDGGAFVITTEYIVVVVLCQMCRGLQVMYIYVVYKNNIYSKKHNDSKTISKELVLGNWACASTCNKIFKRELIKELKFSKKNSDDLMFSIPAILEAKIISYCENNKYYYYQSGNSITRNLHYKTYKENLECLSKVTEYMYNKNKKLAKIYNF